MLPRSQSRQLMIFNTICVLCICVFCVYQIQENAINQIDESRHQMLKQPPIFSVYEKPEKELQEYATIDSEEETTKELVSSDNNVKDNDGPPIWITMAVCFSENTHYHGKDHFPYVESVPLSSQLWLKKTSAKVVVQVVYSEPEVSDKLLKYKKELESYGVLVKLVPTGDMKCVLKAQIIRVLVFLLPEIPKNAVIVTADVDALVMTPKILLPIQKLPNKKIWIYRYAFTYTAGSTFNMPFIGAYSDTWRDILIYDSSMDEPEKGIIGNGIPKMIATYSSFMNFSESYTWDTDQLIVSYSIMKNKLCTLPKENNLWNLLHLEPLDLFDDDATCWRGDGTYEDCNNVLWSRNIIIRYRGGSCKWWHFYPNEDYAAVRSKFEEILANGDNENGILSSVLKSIKNVQKKAFGQILV